MTKQTAVDRLKQQKVERVLAKMAKEGTLTPDYVIEQARNSKSPMHSYFEWDRDKAAMEYWRVQARELISSFTIRIETTGGRLEPVQRFVRDVRKLSHEQGYCDIQEIKSDQQLMRQTLEQHLTIAEGWVQKALLLSRVFGLEQRVGHVAEELAGLKDSVASQSSVTM